MAPEPSGEAASFLARVRALEERLFPDLLAAGEKKRMGSGERGYWWHFRPSHHLRTGLVAEDDIALLREPGRRLLSVGAHPGSLEHVLVALGVPADHLLLADSDPAIAESGLPSAAFDATEPWPDIGTFDRIVFPESLCIAVGNRLKRDGIAADVTHVSDPAEAMILAHVLREALARLRPGGEIRANGPQSHPNVVDRARTLLEEHGPKPVIAYERYFLRVRT
jgi:hypothetical protein